MKLPSENLNLNPYPPSHPTSTYTYRMIIVSRVRNDPLRQLLINHIRKDFNTIFMENIKKIVRKINCFIIFS